MDRQLRMWTHNSSYLSSICSSLCIRTFINLLMLNSDLFRLQGFGPEEPVRPKRTWYCDPSPPCESSSWPSAPRLLPWIKDFNQPLSRLLIPEHGPVWARSRPSVSPARSCCRMAGLPPCLAVMAAALLLTLRTDGKRIYLNFMKECLLVWSFW